MTFQHRCRYIMTNIDFRSHGPVIVITANVKMSACSYHAKKLPRATAWLEGAEGRARHRPLVETFNDTCIVAMDIPNPLVDWIGTSQSVGKSKATASTPEEKRFQRDISSCRGELVAIREKAVLP